MKLRRYRATTETAVSLFLILLLLGGMAVQGVLPAWENWSQQRQRSDHLAADMNRLQQRYDALYEIKTAMENRTGILTERMDNPVDANALAAWAQSLGAQAPAVTGDGSGRFDIEAVFKNPAVFFRLLAAFDEAPWLFALDPFVTMRAVSSERLSVHFRIAAPQAADRTAQDQ